MVNDYKLVKMNSSSIRDDGLIAKYASLGYFHYQYIKSLNPSNSSVNIVKDNGVIRGARVQFKSGSYLQISIADFKSRRKIACWFWFNGDRLKITIGDLDSLCRFIYKNMTVNESDCFVKFDVNSVIND